MRTVTAEALEEEEELSLLIGAYFSDGLHCSHPVPAQEELFKGCSHPAIK